jgi:hypothetical protein
MGWDSGMIFPGFSKSAMAVSAVMMGSSTRIP